MALGFRIRMGYDGIRDRDRDWCAVRTRQALYVLYVLYKGCIQQHKCCTYCADRTRVIRFMNKLSVARTVRTVQGWCVVRYRMSIVRTVRTVQG